MHSVADCTSLTYYSWLQIYKHSARDVLSSPCLTEEGVEGVISTADGLVGRHLAVRLDAVLQTVELPAGIANLHASLPNMNRNTLALQNQTEQIKFECSMHSDQSAAQLLLHFYHLA